MKMLHLTGLLLLPLCGWLLGDAVQARSHAHLAALRQVIELLQRIQQEIQYRRADLPGLYRQLCREGVLEVQPGVSTLQALHAPDILTRAEQTCFRDCFAGLGRTGSAQECERLAYYQTRFAAYLEQVQHAAQMQAGLPHRLGLAGGLMLALLFW